MFLLYLDASGTADPRDVSSKHYVFAGLCMREGAWFGLDRRIQALKQRYRYQGLDFELHVKQFAMTIKEQDEVSGFETLSWPDRRSRVLAVRQAKIAAEPSAKRKRVRRDRYKQTDPFIHLSRRERSRLLEEAVELVAGFDGVRLFAEAVCKEHPQVMAGPVEPVRQAFEQVIARFDTFLRKKDSRKLQVSPRRSIDYGLLILDQDAATETTIEGLFRHFRERGHSFGQLTHVIDVPFFASSAKVGGLQLVDVCSYVVRRYLDTGARPGSHEERQFQKLFPRFDRDTSGKLHGLRHYIPPGKCACLICQERGHTGVGPAVPPTPGSGTRPS